MSEPYSNLGISSMQLFALKENFVHELKRNRAEKQLTQEEMAKLVRVSKRTYQRLEDKKDAECAFMSAIASLYSYSKVSSYDFVDWLVKICNTNPTPSGRSFFKWELDVITAFKAINQQLRRVFSKKLEGCSTEKMELIIATSCILLNCKEKQVANLLGYLLADKGNKDLPDDYVRQLLVHARLHFH